MSNDVREVVTFLGAVIICILVISVVVTVGIMRGIAHPIDASSCRAFGASSGYETRFVDYNFLNWDCLAKTANGKWISTNNLRGVNQ